MKMMNKQAQMFRHQQHALDNINIAVCSKDTHDHRISGFHEFADEINRRFSSSASSLDRLYVTYLIERMDKILDKYRCRRERRGEGVWVYYKRIPSRYWHEMLEAYNVFRSVLGQTANISDDKMKMDLYVRLLPGLAQFDKCRSVGGSGFGVCRRIIYDHLYCLVV